MWEDKPADTALLLLVCLQGLASFMLCMGEGKMQALTLFLMILEVVVPDFRKHEIC